VTNWIKGLARRSQAISRERARRRFSAHRDEYSLDLSFSSAAKRFATRDCLYAYLHHYFVHLLPTELQLHRRYFAAEQRGFGEEAFHSMWYLLLREYRPKRFLEIGVFRGQVISLWALIARLQSDLAEIHCISPFSAAGDDVSDYPNIDFLNDVLLNFRHFGLPQPLHLRALSTDRNAIDYMREHRFDCIYIDGSHDFDVVLSDYRNSVSALNPGGLLVMDDSSLGTEFTPPAFSFAGHPGPSRVAREFADRELIHLGGVGHQNVYRKRP
jgi:Methyltransferase domain